MTRYLDAALLGLNATCSVGGLVLMKSAFNHFRLEGGQWAWSTMPLVLLGVGAFFYIVSFLIWMIVLSRLQLSTAYPVAIGLTLALSTLGSAFHLGESIGAVKLLGIALIFIGIVCVTVRL